jgi:ASPIC and UnbV/FG-GAP-like repeat
MVKAGAILTGLAVLGLVGPPAADAAASSGFETRGIPFAKPLLFDVGVVDFDRDDDLDVFTVNHNDRQSLLANQGGGGFVERLSSVRLDHQPQFPGFEVPGSPQMTENGIYLFRAPGNDLAEGALRLAVEADPGEEVNGRVEFLFPVTVNRDDGADVSIDFESSQVPGRYAVDFTTQGDALIELEPEQMAAPIGVRIDPAVPLSAIHVGSRRVSPVAHDFTLYLRDRHGMAWGDFNRDLQMDVFISRGGLKGRVGELAGLISDEMLLGDGSTFRDAVASSGLVKGACRGRATEPVDFNRDGLLDLFWGCQGAAPALYRGNGDGTFSNVSRRLGRAGVSGKFYRWIDVDGDGRDELLASNRLKMIVYERSRKGRWSRRQRVGTFGDAAGRPAVADFDGDRDPDLFLPSSKAGNTLLVNRDGRFRARGPRRLGLPKGGSFTASWVDYDNDGRTDLYAAPQGLFRKSGTRFHGTGALSTAPTTNESLGTWFDCNADGARDLVRYHSDPVGQAALMENLDHRNHWLEVELTGPAGQYPVAGARVRVRTEDRAQTQWVGQADDTRYSRGHYRLYFGLGGAPEAEAVKVLWPDGSTEKLKRVYADRLLHVTFGGPAGG